MADVSSGIRFNVTGEATTTADATGSTHVASPPESTPSAPAATPPADGKSRYEAPKPSALQFFVEPHYYFFNQMAGVPDGIKTISEFDETSGTYTLGLVGPITSWTPSDISFGLTWATYDRVALPSKEDCPECPRDVKYRQWGFPITFTADFGVHHVTRYSALASYSTEQLQAMGYNVSEDVNDALLDAYMTHDVSSIMNFAQAFDAIISGYDISEDVALTPSEEYLEIPYYRVGVMPAFGFDDFNASRHLTFRNSAKLGAGVYVMGMGGNHFLGLGPHLELTPVRYSHGPVRADLVLNLGANYYMRMQPEYLFNKDAGDFLVPVNGMAQIYSGIGIRLTTNTPKAKTVYKVGKTAVEKGVEIGKKLENDPIEMGEIPLF